MNRSRLVWTLALVLTAIAPAAAQKAQPACQSEAHRRFDFWIGDWTVTGANGQIAGENTIEEILGGCVLFENWNGTSGSTGKSFNMYNAADDRWHQTWVDNSGNRLDLVGGLDDAGRMVLSGTAPAQDGGSALHEISWTRQEDGSVIQHWRASRDGGESWNDLFVGTYRRK